MKQAVFKVSLVPVLIMINLSPKPFCCLNCSRNSSSRELSLVDVSFIRPIKNCSHETNLPIAIRSDTIINRTFRWELISTGTSAISRVFVPRLNLCSTVNLVVEKLCGLEAQVFRHILFFIFFSP